jgi:hypothetical protein
MRIRDYVIPDSSLPYESLRAVVLRGHDVRTRTPTNTFSGY